MKFPPLNVCMLLAFASLVAFAGCPWWKLPGDTQIYDGIEFVWIPSGSFTMGSPADEVGRGLDEVQHQVTISQGFWLGKYEVTQEQWTAVMGSNPSLFPDTVRPVERVSWDDVQYFLAELNAGKGSFAGLYRLPTEAEWEYAYRAGTSTRFYWGDDPDETNIANYAWDFDNSDSMTHNVAEKGPNAWGLYDISGNVWEWCQDWYGDYPAGPVTDPQGPDSGTERVLRGGSWRSSPAYCRAAARRYRLPEIQGGAVGFRLLRTAD